MFNLKLKFRILDDFHIREAYRTLRTNIEFTGLDNRVIAVTSSNPEDGKSSTSLNLANAFAQSGKRVLLIDADLRKSLLINSHSRSAVMGLSHYLSGMATINDIISGTDIENLYVITTGKFPPNPTELLSKEIFKDMLDKLKTKFDYIIIDTPPLGAVIDAAIIAKVSDASLLVVASNTATSKRVKATIKQLTTANPNFLGVVLSKFNVHEARYYGGEKYYKYYEYEYKNND